MLQLTGEARRGKVMWFRKYVLGIWLASAIRIPEVVTQLVKSCCLVM